jgi:DNA-directed RNA polymerase subunit alpha
MNNLFLATHPDINSYLVKNTDTNYTFVIEPLYAGYGQTLGNSLRRVFLSSIPGFAVTKARINNITHEYQAIDGVVEDAIDIILNLKTLRPIINTDEQTVELSLKKTTGGPVYASDFNNKSNAKIFNEDAYICTLNEGSTLEIEIEISRGIGYLATENLKLTENKDVRQILVDAVFSPVTNVAPRVDKVRVGDKTNFDKLSIDFDIDGTVSAKEICNCALDIVLSMFADTKAKLNSSAEKIQVIENEEIPDVVVPEYDPEDIRLPEKITKILTKNEITTNSQLKDKIDLVGDFAGIGAKAMKEIQDYVKLI